MIGLELVGEDEWHMTNAATMPKLKNVEETIR